jgi:hypothetical protein
MMKWFLLTYTWEISSVSVLTSFFSFGRVSHLEALPFAVVYNYLLGACHFSASDISYNLVHWRKGMVCGLFLVGEAGRLSKVFKFMHRYLCFGLILYSQAVRHISMRPPVYILLTRDLWSVTDNSCWCRNQPWESPSVIYFLVIQLSCAVIALVEVFGNMLHQDSCWLNFSFGVEQIGSFAHWINMN